MIRQFRGLVLMAILVMCIFAAQVASAQTPITGTPPFGSFGGGPDGINLANLNSHLNIPVLGKAGRGLPFNFYLTYDSYVWYPATSGSTTSWQPVKNFGWNGSPLKIGNFQYNLITSTSICSPKPNLQFITKNTYVWQYVDGFGTSHKLGTTSVTHNACSNTTTSTSASGITADGSGYSFTINGSTIQQFVSTDGGIIHAPYNGIFGGGTTQDRNGNQISYNSSTNVFTDTLGTTALTIAGSGTPSSPTTLSYTAPSGANASFTMKYATYSVQTNFGCSGIVDYGTNGTTTANLVSEIDLPDGSKYSFSYEPTPGHSGFITGRLYQVTLPTGGTIAYTYSGGNNGINCSDGSTATLTRATPDGTWSYAQAKGSGAASTTTVTDPQGNVTTIQFQGIYETQRLVNQGSSSALLTTNTCYNASASPCTGTAITLPITQQDVYYQPAGGNLQSKHTEKYTSFGVPSELDDYDYGSGAPGGLLQQTQITYAPLGNNINVFRQQVTVKNGAGTVVSQTTYNYDEPNTLTGTSGVPQHVSVSGSRGNLTSIDYPSGSLVSHTTYYDTGTVNTSTDVNGAVTTYSYSGSSCGNAFPTSVSEPLSLSRSMTWNCTGGVQLTATDENNQTTTATYNDAYFWRPAALTDATNVTTNQYYSPGSQPTRQTSSVLNFNSGNSVINTLSSLDGLGRPYLQQLQQAPSSSNYDSVEIDYDSFGRTRRVTVPYQGTAAQTNPSGPATTTSYDALNRPLQTIDGGGGSVTYTYSQNDVYISVNAPSGENAKRRQLEYDALGRLTSVCEITGAAGSGSCLQTNGQTGYWTKYSYDALGNLLTVTQNAQSGTTQTRSYQYDGMSRLTSETNPESGTTTYSFDSASGTSCYANSSGDLIKRVDANGNWTCFNYDALHRITDVGNNNQSATNPARRFRYDNTSGVLGSRPSGVSVNNVMGRLTEAETDNGGEVSAITDAWFSYTARGEVSDVYESTPNSGGYYHSTATYWANGVLNQLNGSDGYAAGWNVDGEGRIYANYNSGTNPLSSTTYNAASQPTQLNFASSDSDSFTYDPNTGRMTQYQSNVNGSPLTGVLGWNPNGTLAAHQVTDPFNSTDNQNCSYSYDDLSRIGTVNCASPELSNPGFENGNTNWSFSNGQCCAVVNNPANAQSGNWYLSISATTDIWAVAQYNGNQWLPVAPGQVVTFGGWLRRVSGTGNIWYSCEVVDASHNFVSWCPAAGIGDGSGGTTWTFYQQQITIPANGAYIIFHAEIHGGNDPDTSLTTAYFDSALFDNPATAPTWTQTFSYDAFGNITKSVPTGGTGYSFQPTYSSSTNRMTNIAGFTPSYDNNGNVLNDSLHAYTWDAYSRPLAVDSVSLTYDALGRMVEQNRSGTYTQFRYSPAGFKMEIVNGQSIQSIVPLPAGDTAVYTNGAFNYIHADWLGSSRLISTSNRTIYFDGAYAPFGEPYAQSGTADLSFTGQRQDTVSGLYDFPAREYSIQGRWPSPDPAGLGAVDPTNPQSWNRYAYVVNNPLAYIDPTGLCDPNTICVNVVFCDGVNTDAPECIPVTQQPWLTTTNFACLFWGGCGGNSPNPPAKNTGGSSGGNSSGFHFQLFPSSLRLPGESFTACIDRTQKALVGNTGQSVLNGVTGVSTIASLFTQPLRTTTVLAPAGTSTGTNIINTVIKTVPDPNTSAVGRLAQVGLNSGDTDAATAAQMTKGAGFVGKIAGLITAIGVGIEGGFAVSCRW